MKKLFYILAFVLIGLLVNLFVCVSSQAQSTRTYTVGSGGDYATYQLAEDDLNQDFVTNDSLITIQGIGGTSTPFGALSVSGGVSSATQHLIITTTGSARHSGTVDSSNAHVIQATGSSLQIPDSFVTVEWLQVQAFNSGVYTVYVLGANNTIQNCILFNTNASGGLYILNMQNANASHYIYNNIIFNTGAKSSRGISIGSATGASYIYNNTVVNCGIGIEEDPNDADIRNNIMIDNTNDTDANSGTPTPQYNATSEASIVGTNNLVNLTTGIFTDYSNWDMHLAHADTSCNDDGMDLTSTVPVDIDGTTRPTTGNSIGADWIDGGGATPEPSKRRRKMILRGEIDYEKDIVRNYLFATAHTVKQ